MAESLAVQCSEQMPDPGRRYLEMIEDHYIPSR
jgi:hypothetical protein